MYTLDIIRITWRFSMAFGARLCKHVYPVPCVPYPRELFKMTQCSRQAGQYIHYNRLTFSDDLHHPGAQQLKNHSLRRIYLHCLTTSSA